MNDWMNWLRTNRYVPYILAMVFAAFLLLNLWSVTGAIPEPLQQQNNGIPTTGSFVDKNVENIQSIVKYPFFGIYIPEGSGEIKPSTLDIKLVGIVYSNVTSQSYVLVETVKGEQKRYGVGDTLPGNALIKKITNNGLVIWYNDHLESIELPSDKLNFMPQITPLKQESL